MSATSGMRAAFVAMSLAVVSVAGSMDVERAREFDQRAEYQAAIDTLLPLARKDAGRSGTARPCLLHERAIQVGYRLARKGGRGRSIECWLL
jgi:hypothetical protein